MRILLAEYAHESNCFAVVPATRERFEEQGLLLGAAALDAHRGRSGVLTGFIHVLEAEGHTAEVALAASAFPAGPVEMGFHAWAVERIVAAARGGGWDGVLLSLHGAMAVEPVGANPDPEGALVAAVRAATGPGVPIGVVLAGAGPLRAGHAGRRPRRAAAADRRTQVRPRRRLKLSRPARDGVDAALP